MPAIESNAADERAVKGEWGPPFDLPNVMIHAHLLPDGKVLFWGRRDAPGDSLDAHVCTPYVWDPIAKSVREAPKPTANGATINLFCSGHTFLPDGRLLVIGGHYADSDGIDQASIYDWRTGQWEETAPMSHGRWYPTAVALPDGGVLASSGSFRDPTGIVMNDEQQVWKDGAWRTIVNFSNLPLYPRMHVDPSGRVFMSGALATSYFLDTGETSNWTSLPGGGGRANGLRDYAPAVMYDDGKILFAGGGNDSDTGEPTAAAEVIDLTVAAPAWQATGSMNYARRQHNATVLPDGSVLVTGGTRKGGFNDLGPGGPIHCAEIWDPLSGLWTALAEEDVDRCYHSVAVLLPDATVLSAGGGEYRPNNGVDQANDPKDSHRDAQIFSPPYLFKGPRPVIASAPSEVSYGKTFDVQTPDAGTIQKVSLVRLASVTHSFDQSQRINLLDFAAEAASLTVTPPADANRCPPGYYMLFLVNEAGAPSVANIVRIAMPEFVEKALLPPPARRRVAMPIATTEPQTVIRDKQIPAEAKGTRVTVGVTPSCPYGIGACWGGAYEALQRLEGVDVVRSVPNAVDSTAEVYLKGHGLPNVDAWPAQFARTANATYGFRGVEVTFHGHPEIRGDRLLLRSAHLEIPLLLAPLVARDRVQWDHGSRRPRSIEESERLAYQELLNSVRQNTLGPAEIAVTGPLKRKGHELVLQVRETHAMRELNRGA